jgi:NADP-dependent 3-hydroxy acid dehydrogenase YdfG
MGYSFEPASLVGKSVVLTGGTTGIGRAIAVRLAAAGADVLTFGRHETELQEALDDIQNQTGQTGGNDETREQTAGQVFGLVADASNPADVERVFQTADEMLGSVDILVNNAALGAHSVQDTEVSEMEYIVRTNLLGYMTCCKHAVERMRAKGEGHIVCIGSMSAQVREKGSDIYVATKSGIEGFTESLRKQVNEYGIKVTLIEPGLVGTEMTTDQVPKEQQPEKQEKGEMLKAEDLAECVYYSLTQPKRSDVVMVQIRPHKQAI